MISNALLGRDGQTVTVRVPLKIRRHGGRKMIIAQEGAAPWAPARARIDNTMVKAIARAFRWRRLLEESQYGSVVELGLPMLLGPLPVEWEIQHRQFMATRQINKLSASTPQPHHPEAAPSTE
jgi:hypothetical protein